MADGPVARKRHDSLQRHNFLVISIITSSSMIQINNVSSCRGLRSSINEARTSHRTNHFHEKLQLHRIQVRIQPKLHEFVPFRPIQTPFYLSEFTCFDYITAASRPFLYISIVRVNNIIFEKVNLNKSTRLLFEKKYSSVLRALCHSFARLPGSDRIVGPPVGHRRSSLAQKTNSLFIFHTK